MDSYSGLYEHPAEELPNLLATTRPLAVDRFLFLLQCRRQFLITTRRTVRLLRDVHIAGYMSAPPRNCMIYWLQRSRSSWIDACICASEISILNGYPLPRLPLTYERMQGSYLHRYHQMLNLENLNKMNFDLTLLDSEVQRKVYEDLLHGPLSNCGEALSVLSEFVFTPLYLLRLVNKSARLKFERAMSELEKRYREMPIGDRQVPPVEIAEIVLEKITKVDDAMLSQMFIELLAKASLKTPIGQIHTAFVSTLSEIVPDEAAIIHHIKINRYIPFVRFMGSPYLPFSDRLTELEKKVEMSVPESLSLYMENLVRLGVLECIDDLIYMGSESRYDGLVKAYSSEDGVAFCHEFDQKHPFRTAPKNVFWKRGFYRYTKYGEKFRLACCANDESGQAQKPTKQDGTSESGGLGVKIIIRRQDGGGDKSP